MKRCGARRVAGGTRGSTGRERRVDTSLGGQGWDEERDGSEQRETRIGILLETPRGSAYDSTRASSHQGYCAASSSTRVDSRRRRRRRARRSFFSSDAATFSFAQSDNAPLLSDLESAQAAVAASRIDEQRRSSSVWPTPPTALSAVEALDALQGAGCSADAACYRLALLRALLSAEGAAAIALRGAFPPRRAGGVGAIDPRRDGGVRRRRTGAMGACSRRVVHAGGREYRVGIVSELLVGRQVDALDGRAYPSPASCPSRRELRRPNLAPTRTRAPSRTCRGPAAELVRGESHQLEPVLTVLLAKHAKGGVVGVLQGSVAGHVQDDGDVAAEGAEVEGLAVLLDGVVVAAFWTARGARGWR